STWCRVPSKTFVIPTPERMRGAEESRYWVLGTGYCIQSANFRQRGEFILAQFWNAASEIVNGCERGKHALAHQSLSAFFAQPAHVAQSQTQRRSEFREPSTEHRVPRFLRPSRMLGGRNDKGFTGYWVLGTR